MTECKSCIVKLPTKEPAYLYLTFDGRKLLKIKVADVYALEFDSEAELETFMEAEGKE